MEFKNVRLSGMHEPRNGNLMHKSNGSITMYCEDDGQARRLLDLYDTAPELLEAAMNLVDNIYTSYEDGDDTVFTDKEDLDRLKGAIAKCVGYKL